MSSDALQARQPCLQKLLPPAKFSATTARAKGDAPLTPCAARLPLEALAWCQPQLDVGDAHFE